MLNSLDYYKYSHGDIADYYYYLKNFCIVFTNPKNNVPSIDRNRIWWKTVNEGSIKIKDMSNTHVLNTYRLLIKRKEKYWSNIFEQEIRYRMIK